MRTDQGEKRQDATLAVIVGAHDQDRILDGNDDDQRPEDQRHDTEDRLRRDGSARARSFRRDLQGIERARPDVAENDAHARQGSRCPSATVLDRSAIPDNRRHGHTPRSNFTMLLDAQRR